MCARTEAGPGMEGSSAEHLVRSGRAHRGMAPDLPTGEADSVWHSGKRPLQATGQRAGVGGRGFQMLSAPSCGDRQAGQVWGAGPGATVLGPCVQQVHGPSGRLAALRAGGLWVPELCVDAAWEEATAIPTPTPTQTQERSPIRAALGILCTVEGRAGRTLCHSEEGSEVQRGEVTCPQSYSQ